MKRLIDILRGDGDSLTEKKEYPEKDLEIVKDYTEHNNHAAAAAMVAKKAGNGKLAGAFEAYEKLLIYFGSNQLIRSVDKELRRRLEHTVNRTFSNSKDVWSSL